MQRLYGKVDVFCKLERYSNINLGKNDLSRGGMGDVPP